MVARDVVARAETIRRACERGQGAATVRAATAVAGRRDVESTYGRLVRVALLIGEGIGGLVLSRSRGGAPSLPTTTRANAHNTIDFIFGLLVASDS